MQQQLHFLKSYLTVRFDFVLPFLQTDLPAAAPIALDFIRSYPFAILFEAFPLTTDNFDRTAARQRLCFRFSVLWAEGRHTAFLQYFTLLPSIPADYPFSIQYFGLPFMPHRPFARRPRRIGEGNNH